jgi:1,4-dihydroxy-2-naphthoyl-CoA synthase
MNDEKFSVCQFFANGGYEYVRRYVDAEEAVKAARHYTSNVAVRMGIVNRVIITDGGDMTVFEWKAGKGVTFPPKEDRDDHRPSEG